jgi:hypothetical protein
MALSAIVRGPDLGAHNRSALRPSAIAETQVSEAKRAARPCKPGGLTWFGAAQVRESGGSTRTVTMTRSAEAISTAIDDEADKRIGWT